MIEVREALARRRVDFFMGVFGEQDVLDEEHERKGETRKREGEARARRLAEIERERTTWASRVRKRSLRGVGGSATSTALVSTGVWRP